MRKNRPDKVANNRLFIVGSNKESIAMLLFCLGKLYLAFKHNAKDIHNLIEVCERKEKPDDEIKNNDWCDTESVKLQWHTYPYAPNPRQICLSAKDFPTNTYLYNFSAIKQIAYPRSLNVSHRTNSFPSWTSRRTSAFWSNSSECMMTMTVLLPLRLTK